MRLINYEPSSSAPAHLTACAPAYLTAPAPAYLTAFAPAYLSAAGSPTVQHLE